MELVSTTKPLPANKHPEKIQVPRWLIASKVLLAALLVTGALFPHVGGFEGKGMLFRLPIFLAPSLIIPIRYWRGKSYLIVLDVGLTLPFLLDTAANAFGIYDSFNRTDDVLHFVNWFILFGAITATIAAGESGRRTPMWIACIAGTGIGAMGAIGWEVAEYMAMQSGVGHLSLTYRDTLSDLVLSTVGGGVGSYIALRFAARKQRNV
jgi:hypothetical protein